MSETVDLWTKVKDVMGGTIKSSVSEMYRLIPDSILFGSILLYFLTQNVAFGVFGIFMIETIFSHRLISWMFSQTTGPSRSITGDKLKCISGFRTPQWKVDRIFNHNNYPAYGVFSITSIGTYLCLAAGEFSKTLQTMGPEWASRKTVAYSLIPIVIAIFLLIRWSDGCDPIEDIIIAMLLAFVVGTLFFFINKQLFGVESMNFLGLPYLVSKESQGSPIYICATEPKTT